MLSTRSKNFIKLRQLNVFDTEKYSTIANAKAKETEGVKLEEALPYSAVPSPSKWQLFRALMPGGMFYKKSVSEIILGLNKKYGPLIIMPGFFGKPTILAVLNPDDYPTILRNEGQYPYRISFESVAYYRKVYRADFFEGNEGLIASNGQEWANIRTLVNPILMNPKTIRVYLDSLLEVNDDFLKRIRDIRDPATLEMPENFEEEINRLSFESVAAIALNKRLGLVNRDGNEEEGKQLLTNLKRVFDLAYYLEFLPSIWKYIKTPKFHEMMRTLDSLTFTCLKYINESLEKIDESKSNAKDNGMEKSVLEKLSETDKKIAVGIALDMMFAGVDTTSTTFVGIFLCIAKNPEKQEKLFEEVKQILPQKNSRLTNEKMRNMPYLRAVIKESMRLYPLMPGTMRRNPHDIVLSGYRIPKGTDIAIGSNLLMQDERYVPRAKDFIPERWLRRNKDSEHLIGETVNPFLYIPFGFGPRSCAGKRFVEMELEINVARLVRNFNIEFNYPTENAFKSKFINVPNIPLKFKFEERAE